MSSRLISPLRLLMYFFFALSLLTSALASEYISVVHECVASTVCWAWVSPLLFYCILFLPYYHTTVLFNLCNLDWEKKLVFHTWSHATHASNKLCSCTHQIPKNLLSFKWHFCYSLHLWQVLLLMSTFEIDHYINNIKQN